MTYRSSCHNSAVNSRDGGGGGRRREEGERRTKRKRKRRRCAGGPLVLEMYFLASQRTEEGRRFLENNTTCISSLSHKRTSKNKWMTMEKVNTSTRTIEWSWRTFPTECCQSNPRERTLAQTCQCRIGKPTLSMDDPLVVWDCQRTTDVH